MVVVMVFSRIRPSRCLQTQRSCALRWLQYTYAWHPNPFVANSHWFEDVAGRHVAAVLPPDVVAAAQERGWARDLDATLAELLIELGQ
jgi:hypothetical protein